MFRPHRKQWNTVLLPFLIRFCPMSMDSLPPNHLPDGRHLQLYSAKQIYIFLEVYVHAARFVVVPVET